MQVINASENSKVVIRSKGFTPKMFLIYLFIKDGQLKEHPAYKLAKASSLRNP